jgi:Tol biopolymer transport system component
MSAGRVAACLFALTLASRAPCAGPFVAYRADDDVTVYDVATETHTNLTNHPSIDGAPSWSGDGRHIAFGSNRDGQPDIYTMDADGGAVRRRTHTARNEHSLAFSPNGRYVAYGLSIDQPREITPIAVLDLRIGVETLVTAGTGVQDESISWFPDSERILFIRRGEGFGIFQVRIDGAMDEQFVLLSHDPALSPDGRRVAHQWGRGREPEIGIYGVDTGAHTILPTELGGINRHPLAPTWVGPERLLVRDNWIDIHLVDIATGDHKPLPLNTYWARGFDPAHPRDVSARGKTPFTWG